MTERKPRFTFTFTYPDGRGWRRRLTWAQFEAWTRRRGYEIDGIIKTSFAGGAIKRIYLEDFDEAGGLVVSRGSGE